MTAEPDKDAGQKGERIAKLMARAGLCSRREAETWIAAGRVSVNGKTLTSAALNVNPGDDVRVDGQALPTAERTRLWLYHKPTGLVTTHKDEKDRPTVFSTLPPNLPRVVSVGRLDLNSEGLLLLTNDGALARELELPARGWKRKYRVRVHGRIDDGRLARLKHGITIEGVSYGPITAVVDDTSGGTKANTWLAVTLTEGKNREVRRVMEHMGLSVNRLIRIAYGPFQLGPLEAGAVEEIPRHVLREQLGVKAEADEKENPRAGWARAKKPTRPHYGPPKHGPSKPRPRPDSKRLDADAARPARPAGAQRSAGRPVDAEGRRAQKRTLHLKAGERGDRAPTSRAPKRGGKPRTPR